MGRSSPQSFEKRQRERRKQRKREEKMEKRLQRAADKRNAKVARETPMFHTLFRDDVQLRVDTDVWLCMLDLAMLQGWTPPSGSGSPEPETFARAAGLDVSDDDAARLSQSLEAELAGISDERVPLEGHEFGEEHTEILLTLCAEGKRIHEEDVLGARAILSGGAKRDASRLASFLKGGAFTVEAG